MDLDVLFVGTAASAPSAQRGLPATLVRRGGDRLLFDCGEGTQRQLLRSTGLVELEEIFLTHFHADHVLGLPGMLKTFSLRQRERPLTVYGPAGLRALFASLRPIVGRVGFPLELVELEPNDELERDGYRIAAYATDHGVPRAGLRDGRGPAPGRFDPERASSSASRPAPTSGACRRARRSRGRPDQVMGEPRRGRARGDRGRHGALRDDAAGGLRGRPARPRGDLPRRGGRPRRARPATPPPARPPSWPRRRASACSRSRTSRPATAARRSATRRARPSRTRSSRATSTASRSPSRSGASRRWSRRRSAKRSGPSPGTPSAAAASRSGRSRKNRWPVPAITSSREPRMRSCQHLAARAGDHAVVVAGEDQRRRRRSRGRRS